MTEAAGGEFAGATGLWRAKIDISSLLDHLVVLRGSKSIDSKDRADFVEGLWFAKVGVTECKDLSAFAECTHCHCNKCVEEILRSKN